MHSQKKVGEDQSQVRSNTDLNSIDKILDGYETFSTFTDRKNYFDKMEQDLAAAVTSGLEFYKVLSIIQEPALQKQIVIAINDSVMNRTQRFSIDKSLIIEILIKRIHPDYQFEFALFTLRRQGIIEFLANDPTDDRFKLIIGKDNQVEHLKKALKFKGFKELYNSPFQFKSRFSIIQPSEQITFITDFIGVDNFLTLYCPLLTLIGLLEVLAPNVRYRFLINDLGINNFKTIMYNDRESSSYNHKNICELLPEDDFMLLHAILFTEEQQLAMNKLAAYRDAIENTNYITTVGSCSNSLHGCVEVETKDGTIKLVSATAKYLLDTIKNNQYILSNHVNTVAKVQDICRQAIDYDKIRPEYKDGLVGKTLKFAIWMSRTNDAIELYTQITEDKIQGIEVSCQSELKEQLVKRQNLM